MWTNSQVRVRWGVEMAKMPFSCQHSSNNRRGNNDFWLPPLSYCCPLTHMAVSSCRSCHYGKWFFRARLDYGGGGACGKDLHLSVSSYDRSLGTTNYNTKEVPSKTLCASVQKILLLVSYIIDDTMLIVSLPSPNRFILHGKATF